MRLAQLHRPLIISTAVMILIAIFAGAGLALDDRELIGVPIWLKPFKFAVSIAIYAVTIAWLLSLLERRRRLGWWLGTVIATAMIGEMVIIVGQAARGRQSHFNNQTPLDSILYSVMGATIAIAWMCTLVLAILLLIQRLPDRANALAVRFGLLVGLGGMMVGFLMTMPTKAQLDRPEGEAPTIVGAHSVGVQDGGPGLPLVNWSTTGGDLRAAHFIGMHALQALPLLGFLLVLASRRFARLSFDRVRARVVTVAGGAYAALTVLLTWQALRGQSIVHPDALTLAALGGLLLATAGGLAWALDRPRTVEVPAAPMLSEVH
ncbi:hypothetical protein ACFO1B_43055 [Dactylosporangium siamense]|uniref:Uncharacterized protein n=1 Tax=Dactylosporangium siamense TaxID=685454 RepID=A0A919UG60_9ACTN|nr:hypothetical protein [Dactylosporangium siamense]GIG50936.1 hypothetical protein Dsi01nite_089770 [Dactylosporangium siamense]